MDNQRKTRILLVGGGTGGHTFPLVAVAKSISALRPDIEIATMGDEKFLRQTSSSLGVPFIYISGPKWDRSSFIAKIGRILSLPLLVFSFIKCLYWMWRFMPDAVFAKGGYPSLIPALVAKFYFIPVYIHESDAIAGSTNRFLARFADIVFLGFDEAKQYFSTNKTITVGVPIRKPTHEISYGGAKLSFKFANDKPIVFITGASQGAMAINQLISTNLIQLCQNFNIIHQCGQSSFAEQAKFIEKLKSENESFKSIIESSYRLFDIMDEANFQSAVIASDAIVSRAGSSLFEFAAYHKPIIAIPLPTAANDHQRANAYAFSKFGARVIEQDNLTYNVLVYEIDQILKNRDQISEQLSGFGFGASDTIAQQIISDINI